MTGGLTAAAIQAASGGKHGAAYAQGMPWRDGSERRSERRYLVRWRVVVRGTNGDSYVGTTCDLSLSGAAILLDSNCEVRSPVMLHLGIPSVTNFDLERRADIVAERVYTILDSRHQCFRVGFRFVQYRGGRAALERRLDLARSSTLGS